MKKQPNRNKQPVQPTEQKPASTGGRFVGMEAKEKITATVTAKLKRRVLPLDVPLETVFYGALGVAFLTNRERLTPDNLCKQWQGCLETAGELLDKAEKHRRLLGGDSSYVPEQVMRRNIRARWKELDPVADTNKDEIPFAEATLILTGRPNTSVERSRATKDVLNSVDEGSAWENRGYAPIEEMLPYWRDFRKDREERLRKKSRKVGSTPGQAPHARKPPKKK